MLLCLIFFLGMLDFFFLGVYDFSLSCRDLILIVTSWKFEYLGNLEKKTGNLNILFLGKGISGKQLIWRLNMIIVLDLILHAL